MTETCAAPSFLAIAEFVMRWVFALGGWGVALWLWKLRREQARRIADHTELNKTIDSALEQLEKFEALVIEFWKNPDSNVMPEQISSGMSNFAFHSMQIKRLADDREYPAKELMDVRRSATLNMEQEERGIVPQKERLGRFVRFTAKLRKSQIYHKRPFSG
ncbi:hypothetical protein [Marinobacter salarius]|uniref:hypothetical protein n=1 Tax=Marinobacter salarius TaxID=1420917 RepID=UPI000F8501FE|nr:hypothetical protein [Marinobacter salarius]AZR42987.1 hypothetical protein MTMN5_03554 [Marinobacter salarius]